MGRWREKAAVKVNPEELFSVTCPCRKEGEAQTGSVPHHTMHLASTEWPKWARRVGLCLSLVLVQPWHRATRWSACRSWRWMCFHMWSEDTCQKMGDANKRLPILMPTYMHHRACIVSNTISVISLQRMGFSSLDSFLADKRRLFYLVPVSVICIPKGWTDKPYWKSSEELPFQVSRKEEQSTL